jgi:hypothetical protein
MSFLHMPRTFAALFVALALAGAACGGDDSPPPVSPDLGGGDADGGLTDLGGDPVDLGAEPADLGPDPVDLGPAPVDMGPVTTAAPNVVGPYAVTRSMTMVGTSPVTLFDPTLPAGVRAPLAVFLPGFQLTVSRYAALCERLASHGVVVVGVDATGGFFPNHVALRDAAIAVIDWAISRAPTAGKTDGSRVMTFGHSLGGKLATMAAGSDSRVTALLAIDPVNGGGGPGMGYTADRPDIVPDVVAALSIPMGFLGETTNASGGFMPCAPGDQNFMTFYDAATSASWAAQWNFIGADHMDFVPDVSACFACAACTAGTADPTTVVRDTQTLTVAFAQRHLFSVTAAEDWLRGAMVPAGIAVTGRP